MNAIKAIFETMIPLFIGLAKTFSYIFKSPVTYQYPEKKREVSDRWRGLHRLKTDNDGRLKCVACGLCEAVCPADVIVVERRETPDGRSFPSRFDINVTRCIFCGYCQEACPKDAIELTKDYEFCGYTREEFHLNRDQLAKMGE